MAAILAPSRWPRDRLHMGCVQHETVLWNIFRCDCDTQALEAELKFVQEIPIGSDIGLLIFFLMKGYGKLLILHHCIYFKGI